MKRWHLLLVLLIPACARGAARPVAAGPGPAASPVAASPAPVARPVVARPVAAPPPSAEAARDALMTALVGRWVGDADAPTGTIPFALAFTREADGAVHARADDGHGFYLDFRFHRDGGIWMFTEEGAIPGVGVQRHTLAPVDGGEPAARWATVDPPGYLEVDVALDGEALHIAARVRGEDHASVRLHRAAGALSSSR